MTQGGRYCLEACSAILPLPPIGIMQLTPHTPSTACALLPQDGDFCLAESGAILRYLCDTRSVADHWYPRRLLLAESKLNFFVPFLPNPSLV